MYEMTGDPGCPDGPCPQIGYDPQRGMVAIQTYDLPPGTDVSHLNSTPPGEHLGEMTRDMFEYLLAQHLDDEAITRIRAIQQTLRAAV